MTSRPTLVRRRRPPWTWRCTDQEYAWHGLVPDSGFAETQAEALAEAARHVRLWHNPDAPTRVCGALTIARLHGTGSCVYPADIEHVHHETTKAFDGSGRTMLVGVDFDEYGRYLT